MPRRGTGARPAAAQGIPTRDRLASNRGYHCQLGPADVVLRGRRWGGVFGTMGNTGTSLFSRQGTTMHTTRRGAALLLALGVITLWGLGAVQTRAVQAPGKPAQKGDATAPNGEKLYNFEFRDAPWKRVLEWLSDQTGLPIITVYKMPTGTFNFIAPRDANGKPKQFTLPEIMDMVNGALQANKDNSYIIIRTPTMLS